MIVLLDVPNPAGGNRALVMVPSDTFSGFELYQVLYFPEKGEMIDSVGEDHVALLCASWVPSLLHFAVERMTRWAVADAQGGMVSLPDFVARMDAWMKTMTAALPAYNHSPGA